MFPKFAKSLVKFVKLFFSIYKFKFTLMSKQKYNSKFQEVRINSNTQIFLFFIIVD